MSIFFILSFLGSAFPGAATVGLRASLATSQNGHHLSGSESSALKLKTSSNCSHMESAMLTCEKSLACKRSLSCEEKNLLESSTRTGHANREITIPCLDHSSPTRIAMHTGKAAPPQTHTHTLYKHDLRMQEYHTGYS